MARRKRRTAHGRTAAKRLQERLTAIAERQKIARKALVFELKAQAQRREIDRQLRAAGIRRGRRRAKR
ncbi:MAG TPA: hypothetical protein VJJ46_09665 [Anaerolineales bacterium]|nr:hypothetical protein [Anaerolineales bacterium]